MQLLCEASQNLKLPREVQRQQVQKTTRTADTGKQNQRAKKVRETEKRECERVPLQMVLAHVCVCCCLCFFLIVLR